MIDQMHIDANLERSGHLPGRRPQRREWIIQLLKEEETIQAIIANKVRGCATYANTVKKEWFRDLPQSQE
jgi:hypothetical protein